MSVFRGTAFLGISYTGKADGAWYFHARAVNSSGVGGPTTTRQLHIDVTAPVTSDAPPRRWPRTATAPGAGPARP